MSTTVLWTGTLTATSSVAHGGQTRGTITLLRRELIVRPDGRTVHVPIVSGNSLRGRLRRIGEELLRDALHYEGELPLAAAHALRGGGALAKTSHTPLSGQRLADLRALVPQVGVFGCAAGGRIIDGCLQVGKVVPYLAETAHILPGQHPRLASFDATQIESYVRSDDSDDHSFTTVHCHRVPVDPSGQPQLDELPDTDGSGQTSQQMLYRVETFPAGTRFGTWLRLDRASDLELAFFTDVLACFASGQGRLGGRAAIGHGQVHTELHRTVLSGQPTDVDWQSHLHQHRSAAMTALNTLT